MPLSATSRGIVYMLVASLFFAMMTVFTKLLADVPIAEIIFIRGLIAAVLCMLGIWRLRISPWGSDRPGLLLRGLAGTVSLAQGFWRPPR
jgi:drug/metabolite transporter (DMT)-like permease